MAPAASAVAANVDLLPSAALWDMVSTALLAERHVCALANDIPEQRRPGRRRQLHEVADKHDSEATERLFVAPNSLQSHGNAVDHSRRAHAHFVHNEQVLVGESALQFGELHVTELDRRAPDWNAKQTVQDATMLQVSCRNPGRAAVHNAASVGCSEIRCESAHEGLAHPGPALQQQSQRLRSSTVSGARAGELVKVLGQGAEKRHLLNVRRPVGTDEFVK